MDLFLFNILHGFAGMSVWGDFFIIFFAKYAIWLMVLLICGWLVWKRQWWRLFISLGSAAVSRGVLVEVIRFFYHKPRPFVVMHFTPLIEAVKGVDMFTHEYSFPSGHAAIVFALAFSIYRYDKKIGVWMYVLAILISIARVISGVHYPSDIVGGAVVGILTAFVGEWVMAKFSKTSFGQKTLKYIL